MVKYSDEFPKAEEPTDKDLGWIAKEQADAIKAYPGLWDFLVSYQGSKCYEIYMHDEDDPCSGCDLAPMGRWCLECKHYQE